MIFYGDYRIHEGVFRPFITGYVRKEGGKWHEFSFFVDSGADETFLHYRSIDILGIDISHIEVRDDVGGIGGYGVPYFRHPIELKLISVEGNAIFSGDVNVFLDPHATKLPILGRDVLVDDYCDIRQGSESSSFGQISRYLSNSQGKLI
ncbi:MAG: hypothetical protein H8D67_05400 [Deltaproteobacteria bacterium]|nr:hypothetical protein [Deltaproteobacteria bacterium]